MSAAKSPEQQDYDVVRTHVHVVNGDPVAALTKAHREIERIRKLLGHESLITLTVTAHLPKRPALHEDNTTE